MFQHYVLYKSRNTGVTTKVPVASMKEARSHFNAAKRYPVLRPVGIHLDYTE